MIMQVNPNFDAAESLFERRLPSRALQYWVQRGVVRREVLHALQITDQTIGTLLQSFGVDIRQVVTETMHSHLSGVRLGEGEDIWEFLDPKMRMEENPLVEPVHRLLVQLNATEAPEG